MTRQQVDEYAEETQQELLLADGFDDCILGIGEQFTKTFVVYDKGKVLQALVRQGMSPDEAQEYFNFNIVGAYVGEHTPAFLWTGQ